VGDAAFYPEFTAKKDLEWYQLTLKGWGMALYLPIRPENT